MRRRNLTGENKVGRSVTNRICILIFLGAFAIRFSSTVQRPPVPDNIYESTRIALSLARHNTFADPFLIPTGPTAHVAPAFPLVLSLVYRLLGDGTAAEIGKRFLNCVVSSLLYALMPWVARVLGLDVVVGLTAAIIGAVIPLQRYAESAASWETPWAAVLLMLLAAWTRERLRRKNVADLAIVGAGAIWGVALLFTPALVSVYAGFLWLLRNHLRTIVLSAAVTLVALTPWAFRNHRQLGTWVWLRDNLGLELSISNADGANARLDANLRAQYLIGFHPNGSAVEAIRVRNLGEVEYNRRRLWQAMQWIRNNPGRFGRLTAARVFYFWFPWVPSPWHRIFLGLVTALAILGLVQTFRVEPVTARIIAAIWIAYPIIFYIVQFDRRYRHPMEWTLLLMATQGVLGACARTERRVKL